MATFPLYLLFWSSMGAAPLVSETTVVTDVRLSVRTAKPHHARGAVIVLHGGPGTSHDHLEVMERLAPDLDLTVVNFDQRGAGGSTGPADKNAYSFEDYNRDIDAVRVASGHERVHLFGHSWGALAALAYALKHPDHVDSLVLADSAAPAKALAGDISNERVEIFQSLGVVQNPLPPVVDGDCTAWLREWIKVLNSRPGTVGEQLSDTTCKTGPRDRTWAVLGDYNVLCQLGRISAPVLVIYGADDPFGARQVAALARYAYRFGGHVSEVEIAACGHRPMHECPDEFFSAVESFYRGLMGTGMAKESETAQSLPIHSAEITLRRFMAPPNAAPTAGGCAVVVTDPEGGPAAGVRVLTDMARVVRAEPLVLQVNEDEAASIEATEARRKSVYVWSTPCSGSEICVDPP